jgi:ABC-type phosphate/phosphonate transport system substrate-binding protein
MSEAVACARMYAVTPAARAAWRSLFQSVAEAADVPLEVIDHAFPAPLNALWERDDLGAAFMCGWPLARSGFAKRIVVAPVPNDPFSEGRPIYRSHFVVAAGAPFQTLADTFGHRMAFTVEDSHSGYNAPRHHLLPERIARGGAPLFSEMIGPLYAPRKVLDAILAGEADVGPLDSYAFALMTGHDAELAGKVRVVASTVAVPIPPIVASPGIDPAEVERLADAFVALSAEEPAMKTLLLKGFSRIDAEDYRETLRWDEDAVRNGLERMH